LAGSILRTPHLESDMTPPRPARARRRPALLSRKLAGGLRFILEGYQSFCDRQLLASLGDRELRDLGLGRADVDGASANSFWHRREP
jgi:uncharacterized protein YjiS (DUF1127 family)